MNMGLVQIVCLVLVACTATFVDSKKLPPSFKTCPRDAPNLDECTRAAVEDALTKTLYKGDPSLGILPLDPLAITTLAIGRGTGSVNIDITFNNLKVYGLKNLSVAKFHHNVEEYTITAEAIVPDLRLEGDYDMEGKILLLPVTGKGKSTISFSDLKAVVKLVGEPFTKNNQKFIKITVFDVQMFPKKMQMHFDNLFNGDQALGKTMNKLLNDNWEIVMADMRPGIEAALEQVFTTISNQIYTNVPYDDIYPPTSN
ncbi:protein takeout-like [Periplaneta americana]|uniref:protein takeout-like n=1 Tax=Periplaneta americana TaxID=6978 RepID=UPI0037E874D8